MLVHFAVVGISLPELLFIGAVAIVVYGVRSLRGLPRGLGDLVREVQSEIRAYHEDKQKQTGHAEADNR